MAENKYRVQDEDGIIQFETLKDAIETIQMDPAKLAFIVQNSTSKIVAVWMKDTVGLGDVWIWSIPPEFTAQVNYWLDYIETNAKMVEGVPQKYADEIVKLIERRGAEKIYERLVEDVWDYIADNCSFPADADDEDETAGRMQNYAFGVFKKMYLSDKSQGQEI